LPLADGAGVLEQFVGEEIQYREELFGGRD
jgi:hypothetical protein